MRAISIEPPARPAGEPSLDKLVPQAQALARQYGRPSAVAEALGIGLVRENRQFMARANGTPADGLLWRLPAYGPQMVVADHLNRREAEGVIAHELGHFFGLKDEHECDVISGAMVAELRLGDLEEQPHETRERVLLAERRAREAQAHLR